MAYASGRTHIMYPVKNRHVFKDILLSETIPGRIFVPGDMAVQPGDEVDLEIHFVEENTRFQMRTFVRYRRFPTFQNTRPPGAEFEAVSHDRPTQDMMWRFIQGESMVTFAERQARRFAVHREVTMQYQGNTWSAVCDDLSEGGCFLLSSQLLPVGSVAIIKIRQSWWNHIRIPARIVWMREQHGRTGMGISFEFEEQKQQEKVQQLVEQLRQRLTTHIEAPPSIPSRESIVTLSNQNSYSV
jgi:Tfp pilus assembly protein PilZ